MTSPLLKMGYTSSTGKDEKFYQATITIASGNDSYILEETGTVTFNPEIIQLLGKYSIIGNVDWQEDVNTNYI